MFERHRFPRGTVIGRRVDDPPVRSETDHYFKCETCGGFYDMHDLGQIYDLDGPLPHPAEDQMQ